MMFMRLIVVFCFVLASVVCGRRHPLLHLRASRPEARKTVHPSPTSIPPAIQKHKYLNERTADFAVNGTSLPNVNFDIGESYAGLLPISNDTDPQELYFWFFPSTTEDTQKEILVWLNGGPGCSSLEGLLQENGPFIWQPGTESPIPNPWTWVNLTNVVWIDQPVGTGFTRGTPTASTDKDVAQQFLTFFKNFVTTFAMEEYTVYLAGESHAGTYIPYIADAMYTANDTTYFNISSILLYDPSISYETIQSQVALLSFLDGWSSIFHLGNNFLSSIESIAISCGYSSYISDNLVFPPQPSLLSRNSNITTPDEACDILSLAITYLTALYPCFNIYNIMQSTCPVPYDPLGFAGTIPHASSISSLYFARPDVQKAIHASHSGANWTECADDVYVTSDGEDHSPPPATNGILRRVIEKSSRTLIVHGEFDFLMQPNGTLLAVQNLTWGGTRGFSKYPDRDFYVPPPALPLLKGLPITNRRQVALDTGDTLEDLLYDEVSTTGTAAGSGLMGKFVSERNLTFILQWGSGHMVPQYVPAAAYRHVEFLLGRISVSDLEPPSTDHDNKSNEVVEAWDEDTGKTIESGVSEVDAVTTVYYEDAHTMTGTLTMDRPTQSSRSAMDYGDPIATVRRIGG